MYKKIFITVLYILFFFVSFILANYFLDGTIMFFNLFTIALGGLSWLRLVYIVLFLIMKLFFISGFYYLLLTLSSFTNNKSMKNWLLKLRYDTELKKEVFFFTLLIVPMIYILYATLSGNIKGLIDIFSELILQIVVLSPVYSLIVLYVCWWLWDLGKNKLLDLKNTQDKDIILNNEISCTDDIEKLKYINLNFILFILLSICTNQLFCFILMFYIRNFVKNFYKKDIPIKFCCFPIFMLVILFIVNNSVIKEIIVNLLPFDSAHILFILLGLIYLYFIYLFVNKVLLVLEYSAQEFHNKDIKYSRIYAYLFGMTYLLYAINTYKNRLYSTNYNE